jgi:hypothetical protein
MFVSEESVMYKPAKLISTFAGLALCGTIAATAAQA